MLHAIISEFQDQNSYMYTILAFVVVGWVIILERFVSLQLIYNLNFQKFCDQIKKMLAAGDMDRAKKYSRATSKVGLPYIAQKAIEVYDVDTFRVKGTLNEELLLFIPRIHRRLNQLPSFAGCIMLIGSIGTLNSIWLSFNSAEKIALELRSITISQGLNNAFLPMIVSIVGAILLLLPYGILQGMAKQLEANLHYGTAVLANALTSDFQITNSITGVDNVKFHNKETQQNLTDNFENTKNNSNMTKEKATSSKNTSDRQEPKLDEEEII